MLFNVLPVDTLIWSLFNPCWKQRTGNSILLSELLKVSADKDASRQSVHAAPHVRCLGYNFRWIDSMSWLCEVENTMLHAENRKNIVRSQTHFKITQKLFPSWTKHVLGFTRQILKSIDPYTVYNTAINMNVQYILFCVHKPSSP